MKNYKGIFSALATKGAVEVYLYVYRKCKVKEYPSFDEIRTELKFNPNTLRRITNRLSRYDLIYSAQPDGEDGRRRVYLVSSPALAMMIESICEI